MGLTMHSLFTKIEKFYEKYERHISSVALVGGFIFDSLTLRRIDMLFDNLTFIVYLVISGGGIALLNYFQEHPPKKDFSKKVEEFLPVFIQFAFGGLFSGFFIFYSRSSNLASSWPFILFLLFLLIGNEFFKGYYKRLTFQVSIYFVAIFSFSIFFVPVILKSMNAFIFILSGFFSLFIIDLFSRGLFRVVPKRYRESRITLRNSILSIYVIINILYFTNLIPPIPLSLKNVGVYYAVERVGEDYKVIGEKKTWQEKIPVISTNIVHIKEGEPLYLFSSVFAPTDLDVKVIHDWQYYDESSSRWVSTTRIAFPIIGGRGDGYRGFSKKENIFDGRWRVDVKTERDQIIGRINFTVITSFADVRLEEKVL